MPIQVNKTTKNNSIKTDQTCSTDGCTHCKQWAHWRLILIALVLFALGVLVGGMMGKYHAYEKGEYRGDYMMDGGMMEKMKMMDDDDYEDDHKMKKSDDIDMDVLQSFYDGLGETNVTVEQLAARYAAVFSDDWVNNDEAVTPEMFANKVRGFHGLIPDMSWEIVDTWVAGDSVTVLGKATGTPVGDFFGVPTDGTKSFEIMSIDVHEFEDGKISETYHIEDWSAAVVQLTSE